MLVTRMAMVEQRRRRGRRVRRCGASLLLVAGQAQVGSVQVQVQRGHLAGPLQLGRVGGRCGGGGARHHVAGGPIEGDLTVTWAGLSRPTGTRDWPLVRCRFPPQRCATDGRGPASTGRWGASGVAATEGGRCAPTEARGVADWGRRRGSQLNGTRPSGAAVGSWQCASGPWNSLFCTLSLATFAWACLCWAIAGKKHLEVSSPFSLSLGRSEIGILIHRRHT